MYQADISDRYLGSIYRAQRSQHMQPFLIRQPVVHIAMRPRRGWTARRTLRDMASRRSVVDYGLARRATLASVYAGNTTVTDVCDAHPYLLRAAKHHGEPTDVRCPICRKANLTHVTYVYGDELGQYAGRVKRGPELTEMAAEYSEFRVYVVEVCQSCGWNHLATSYVLGTGEPPARRGRRARSGQ